MAASSPVVNQIHFEPDSLPKAVFAAVFLFLLHGLLHIGRLYVSVFLEGGSFDGWRGLMPVVEKVFHLSLLVGGWTLLQAIPALWSRGLDAVSVVYFLAVGSSIGLVIYAWLFWLLVQKSLLLNS